MDYKRALFEKAFHSMGDTLGRAMFIHGLPLSMRVNAEAAEMLRYINKPTQVYGIPWTVSSDAEIAVRDVGNNPLLGQCKMTDADRGNYLMPMCLVDFDDGAVERFMRVIKRSEVERYEKETTNG